MTTLLALVLALGAGSAWAQTSSWTAASGTFGTSGNWDNGTPDSSTGAYFTTAGSYLVTFGAAAASSNLVVSTGTATFDLDGFTYSAGQHAGIQIVNGGTLIVTNGLLRAFADAAATSLLTVDSTSTVQINSGGTLDMTANNGAPALYSSYTGGKFIVDGGTFVDQWPRGGGAVASLLVTNGGAASFIYNGSASPAIVTGPGSSLSIGYDPYSGPPVMNGGSITVDNGASLLGYIAQNGGGTYNMPVTVKGGSMWNVGYLHGGQGTYSDQNRYNIYSSTLTTTLAPANNRAIELNNYYGAGQMTMSNAIVEISPSKALGIVAESDQPNQAVLRGTG
ncbi:hypothetical protein HQ590_13430, partial [bacterium]|nr:hypothetical protein [bacterium]